MTLAALKPGTVPPESEAHFQAAIVDLARRLGWLVYHTHDSRRSQAGFPDLFMVRGEHALAAELKSATGRLSPEQTEWIARLRMAGIDAHVWRPADKAKIVEILSRDR